MWKSLACFVVVAAALGASVLRDASAQDTTLTPGQPTSARVWIENRDRADALPVRIEMVAADVPPLRVELVGTPTMTVGQTALVNTRAARQQWEYQVIGVPAGADPTAALNAAGQDGWETTGLSLGSGQGAAIVMKRPR